MDVVERVPCEYLDGLECPCGNATHLDGFDTCTPEGVLVDPDAAEWTGTVRCLTCGRLYDTNSHDGQTVAVVKGPDLTCRDCGLGAYVAADGRAKGERDVDPCPQGDDDFHHWVGVVRSTCVNPQHSHDAVTDEAGGADPTTNLCNDDQRPLHYDNTQGWYFHDDPDPAKGCFLSGPNAENPCYTADEVEQAKKWCKAARWPEQHRDDCLWCKHLTRTRTGANADA